MTDTSDVDYNPNVKQDIDSRRKRCSKRKRRNAGGTRNNAKPIIYQCSLCLYQTDFRNKLKRHFAVCFLMPKSLRQQPPKENIVTSRATFKCEFCFFSTTTSLLLAKHKSSHANRIHAGLVECSHCNVSFFTLAECKKHMNEVSLLQQTDTDKSQCIRYESEEEDDISFNEEWLFPEGITNNSEVSTEDRRNGSLYSCSCGMFQTDSRPHYLRHLKQIHNTNFKSFEEIKENGNAREEDIENEHYMTECSFHADNEYELEINRTPSHELEVGEDSITEQDSGRSTLRILRLLEEQVNFIEVYTNDEDDDDDDEVPSKTDETIVEPQDLTCEFCAYETTDSLDLTFHSRLKHTLNNIYRCPQTDCLFQSANKQSFESHLLDTHQIRDIVGNQGRGSLIIPKSNGIKNGPTNQIPHEPSVSEWFEASEDETIQIEIIEDEPDNKTEVDSIEENRIRKSSLRVKCMNVGCNYYSPYDTESIKKHAALCLYKPKVSEDIFKCKLCENVYSSNQYLMSHLTRKHFYSEKSKRASKFNQNIQRPTFSDKISYTCWMCNSVLKHKSTLKNHAHIHGREENNFDLVVRFSQFNGDVRVDTIEITCDIKSTSNASSNMPLYKKNGNCRDIRLPLLDYDPKLPVFSCAECNFKTNEEKSLSEHKKLHWNAEKDAAYKAKKWLTCGTCSYYCFDAERLKQHEEMHEKRHISASKTLVVNGTSF